MMETVKYEVTPDGMSIDTGHPMLGVIKRDYGDEITGNERFGLGHRILAASVLSCFCSNLYSALESRGVIPKSVRASANVYKELHDNIPWIDKVELDVQVEAEEKDRETVEHCIRIIRDCPIKRSVIKGVEITVKSSVA